MNANRPTTPVSRRRFQPHRGAVLAAMTAALFGALALVSEARAASPQTAAAQLEPANWLGANRKSKKTSTVKSSDASSGRRSCWEYRRHQGRLKRVNVCFREGR
jgi:hypothetical protein